MFSFNLFIYLINFSPLSHLPTLRFAKKKGDSVFVDDISRLFIYYVGRKRDQYLGVVDFCSNGNIRLA